MNNISDTWFDLNQPEKAMEFFEATINLNNVKPSRKLCSLLINGSRWLGELAKHDRRLSMLERAVRIAEQQNYKLEHAQAIFAIGGLYFELENYECASTYLTQAETEARSLNNWALVSRIQIIIRKVLVELENYNEAREKVEAASEDDSVPELQLRKFTTLGRIYSELSRGKQEPERTEHFQKSKMNYESALKLAEKLRDLEQIFGCNQSLAALHEQHRAFDEAVRYLNAAQNVAVNLTCQQKQGLFHAYAACAMSKCLAAENESDTERWRSALLEAEEWLVKSEECYNQMWNELTEDYFKITWSNTMADLSRAIQDVE